MNLKINVVSALALTMLVIGSANGQILKKRVSTVSSVKCETKATGKDIAFSQDAITVSVASAFDVACARHDDGYVRKVEVAYMRWAEMYAAAITQVIAKCSTTGSAFGCASASAYAKSLFEATAVTFEKAVVKASATCACVAGRQAEALAKAIGSAAKFNMLNVKAFSAVSVAVCAAKGQAASASVFQTCLASAVSKVFTKATAEALAVNDCYLEGVKQKIKVATAGDAYITQGCKKQTRRSGNGKIAIESAGQAEVGNVKEFFETIQSSKA